MLVLNRRIFLLPRVEVATGGFTIALTEARFAKRGFSSGTLRRFGANRLIRTNLRIDSRESSHLRFQ